MSYKGFQESRPRFSNLLTGQCWIFLKKGLDDFRDGFPPSPGNMLVNGRKQPVSITLENSTPKSLSRAPWKKRNQCSRAEVCLCKLSLLQQARKDYVAQKECYLSQQPSVCYPCLEKSTSPKILKEVAGVLDPDMMLKSKTGYSDYEQENQPGQEVLGHMEDMQSKVTASKTQEIEVTQLYSTQAFKEFLERKGLRQPLFLWKMVAEKMIELQRSQPKLARKCLKRYNKIREGCS